MQNGDFPPSLPSVKNFVPFSWIFVRFYFEQKVTEVTKEKLPLTPPRDVRVQRRFFAVEGQGSLLNVRMSSRPLSKSSGRACEPGAEPNTIIRSLAINLTIISIGGFP